MIPVDIVQPVHQPGNVVKIGYRAFAVAAGLKIHDRGGGPASAGVNPPTADLDVMHRVKPMQGELAAGAGDHIFDQRAGKAQPAFIVHPASRRHRPRFKAGRQLRQAKVFKKLQHQVVDLQDLAIGQGFVAAAHHAR